MASAQGASETAAMPLRSPAETRAKLVTDQLDKPSLDTRSYRVIRLENDLEVLIAHDPDTDKASAAMDINVGSFCDEPDMPGMAHAVEHLLFLGTKTFPGENEYNQYVTSHSGISNAYTSGLSTNYWFELSGKAANDEPLSAENPSPLHGALDRFSKFFIEPLFQPSAVDRELRAVDSEHKKNLQDDNWRIDNLDRALSNPNHPWSNFTTGTLESLKLLPESRGVNVRDKFIEFHNRHYSANRMKLVVLGREPLDLLESWVVGFFSGVPNKNLEPNRWEDEVPYRAEDKGIQIFAKPIMEVRDLNLAFSIPEQRDLYESQPSRYVSHLIGHEGPGSIMAYTKSKGWVTGLSAGATETCPGSPSKFECQIHLTEEGLEHWREVATIFFQYVAILRDARPQEWVFREQKTIQDVEFKFREKTRAGGFTSRTANKMQAPLPREWLLRDFSAHKFEPGLVSDVLDALNPDNVRLTVVSQTYPGNWDQKEKYYGIEYRTEPIPADFMEKLGRASASTGAAPPELHLPHKNSFLPTKLEVEKKEVEKPAVAPRLIRNDVHARTWWKKDDTFWVPRADVIVSLINPMFRASPANAVRATIFVDLIHDALEEYSYDASIAGLHYGLIAGDDLILEITGFNDKLPVLAEKVLTTMRDIEFRQDRFDIIKDRLRRSFSNWQLKAPYMQLDAATSWLNTDQRSHVEERLAELEGTTLESTWMFYRQIMSQFFIQVYAHGNIYRDEALALTDLVKSTLRPRVLPREQMRAWRSLIIPPGSNFVYEKALKDPGNVNHAIEYVVYTGAYADTKVGAMTLLLDQLVEEPVFNQLRTKEQLGYIVFSSLRYFDTRQGLRILIQSEKSPQYLESRIEAFLDQYTEVLEDMSEEKFDAHKRAVISRRLEKLKNLDQETSRHWFHISSNILNFDLASQDAENVKKITKNEMMEAWRKLVHPASTERAKLSVRLFALGTLSPDKKVAELVEDLGLDEAAGLKLKAVLLQSEKRHDLTSLKEFLKYDLHLSTENVAKVLELAEKSQHEQDAELIKGEAGEALAKVPVQTAGKPVQSEEDRGVEAQAEDAPEKEQELRPGPACAIKPVYIKDVWTFRAGLVASKALAPVKDLSEFEDLDAKL